MSALLHPYCSIAQVRAELRNHDGNDCDDPTISAAINAASRWIDRYKGRDYFKHDHTVTPLKLRLSDGYFRQDRLWLPYWPIITLTLVSVQEETWVQDEDYYRTFDGLALATMGGDWPGGNSAGTETELTGSFGYAQAATTEVPTGMPMEISKACVLVATNLTGKNQKDVAGLAGTPMTILDKSIPKPVFELLGARKLVCG